MKPRSLIAALLAGLSLAGFAQAQTVIRIGAPLPMTGPLSPEGQRLKQGHDLWADTVNKAGGIQVGANKVKVELLYADYQSNTPRAVQLADKLITDGTAEADALKALAADRAERKKKGAPPKPAATGAAANAAPPTT